MQLTFLKFNFFQVLPKRTTNLPHFLPATLVQKTQKDLLKPQEQRLPSKQGNNSTKVYLSTRPVLNTVGIRTPDVLNSSFQMLFSILFPVRFNGYTIQKPERTFSAKLDHLYKRKMFYDFFIYKTV